MLDKTLSKARLRVWLRLLGATRAIEHRLREEMREGFGSTLPRFDVMATLDRYGALRMSELSGKLRVSNGNVTGIVERLVADGLVERVAVEGDRRAMQVRLTDAGRADFARMAEAHEGWVDEMLGRYDADELDTLVRLLSRMGEDRR